jgi:hypothetical protein
MSAPKVQNGFVSERIVSSAWLDETIDGEKNTCDFNGIAESGAASGLVARG